jgi:hypothetical protein
MKMNIMVLDKVPSQTGIHQLYNGYLRYGNGSNQGTYEALTFEMADGVMVTSLE